MRYTRIILILIIPISLFSKKIGQHDDIETIIGKTQKQFEKASDYQVTMRQNSNFIHNHETKSLQPINFERILSFFDKYFLALFQYLGTLVINWPRGNNLFFINFSSKNNKC